MGKWTKAELNQLRRLMTTQGRDIDQIAEEIRHLCGCSKLAAYRMAHGWSQPEAAERYKQATSAFMDQPLLSKLEQFPTDSTRARWPPNSSAWPRSTPPPRCTSSPPTPSTGSSPTSAMC